MPWHTPERKTEQALKLYFESVLGYELSGVQICTRFGNLEKTEPRIEIACESCEPYPAGVQVHTGTWLVNAKITVYSHFQKDVDAEAHDNIIGSLLDNLLVSDENGNDAAAAEINATQNESAFTVQEIEIKGRTNRVEEHSIVTEQELELIINPS